MVRKLVVDVPDDLKAEFKIYCMKNGTSIHQQIVQFMQDILDGTEEENRMESVDQTEGSRVQGGSKQTVRVTEGLVERDVRVTEAALGPQVSPLQLRKTMEFDVRTFRNALNLKGEKKGETISFPMEPLDIGL